MHPIDQSRKLMGYSIAVTGLASTLVGVFAVLVFPVLKWGFADAHKWVKWWRSSVLSVPYSLASIFSTAFTALVELALLSVLVIVLARFRRCPITSVVAVCAVGPLVIALALAKECLLVCCSFGSTIAMWDPPSFVFEFMVWMPVVLTGICVWLVAILMLRTGHLAAALATISASAMMWKMPMLESTLLLYFYL